VRTPVLVRAGFVVLAALALGSLAGCGASSKPVTVSGKVILPAKAKFTDTDTMSVTFVPDGEGGKSASTNTTPKDHTFTAQVLPGKYKVGVAAVVYSGTKDSENRSQAFEKIFAPFNSMTSTMKYEVTGDATITIDLNAQTVK
jgi:hypothetical protein